MRVPAEWIGGALGFARTAHLVASHWYYIFMAFHDFDRGYVLFALDYGAIIVLFATTAQYIGKLLGSLLTTR